jgi:hypothetical protein
VTRTQSHDTWKHFTYKCLSEPFHSSLLALEPIQDNRHRLGRFKVLMRHWLNHMFPDPREEDVPLDPVQSLHVEADNVVCRLPKGINVDRSRSSTPVLGFVAAP